MATPAKKAIPSLSSLGNKEEEPTKLPVGPDSDKSDVIVPIDTSADSVQNEEGNREDTGLSPHVVSTVPNRTPAELAAETPDETAARYGINTKITKEDAENPRVQVYADTQVRQIPSGTHLHPDVAKDLQNRGIAQHTTDSAQISRTVTEGYAFAPDAEYNDKFQKPVEVEEEKFDRDEDYSDDDTHDPFLKSDFQK